MIRPMLSPRFLAALSLAAACMALAPASSYAQDTRGGAPAPAASPAAPAAAPAADAKPAAEAKPGLVFVSTKADFGKIREGESADIAWEVENTSGKEVKILQVRPGCGCTSAKNNPTVLKPGEKSKINVTFNSKGRPGKSVKSVLVQTDDEGQKEYRLEFSGFVFRDVYLKEQMLNFETIQVGEAAKKTFSFVSLVPDVTVTKVACEDERITVAEIGKKEIAEDDRKGTEVTYEVTIPANYPQSDFYKKITVETGNENYKSMTIHARGRVVGEIDVSPQRLFAVVTLNNKSEKTLTLSSRKDAGFKINEVKIADQSLPIAFEVKDGKKASEKTIVATITGGDKPQTLQSTMTINYTKDGSDQPQTMTVPLTAIIREEPAKKLTAAGAAKPAPKVGEKSAGPAVPAATGAEKAAAPAAPAAEKK